MIMTNKAVNETAENQETVLLRQTTASIADALLRLGGSDDGGDSSSSSQMENKRKRTISLVAESDVASTSSQTTQTETDVQSSKILTNKRQRKSPIPPSQVVCPVSNEAGPSGSSKSKPNLVRAEMNSKVLDEKDEQRALSFSTSEFQREVQIQPSQRKVPGDIGCISQMFHRDFRPLNAAPRMPREIVPDFPPPMPARASRFAPPTNPGTMYSTAITEHNDCLIMHSYTVLPRLVAPHHMALAQLTNGM